MNIADTSNYTIRVNYDIFYVKNKTTGSLEYSLYKEEQSLSLINTTTLLTLEEKAIVFDGDGTYKVYIGNDIVEIRYYLQLQTSLITTIGDFLCTCCEYSRIDYDCSCATPIDIKCVQFSAIPLMLLSYQHLVSYCLNGCCAGQYLYDSANEYEHILRESYLGHIREECIKGKSLYGTKGLRYIVSIYYALFLEAELEARDSIDSDFIYTKFDYDRIRECMEDLGINYNKLKEIMGLCDDRFTQIFDELDEINTKVDVVTGVVNNISTSVGDYNGSTLQEDITIINNTVDIIESTVENCCLTPENLPPIADAGADEIISVSDTILLDGTGSSDSDGTIVSYLWQVISSPVLVTMATPTTATNFVSGFSIEGIYTFSLTITDDKGATSVDTITITVGAVTPIALNSIINNNRAGNCAAAYTFSATDFDYTPSGYTLESINVEAITVITNGILKYNALAITTPLTIAIANIGLLVYTPDNTNTAQYSEPFSFSIKTTESANQSNIASMNIANTSCATTIAQIQLKDHDSVEFGCGSYYVIPGVTSGSTGTRIYKISNIGDLALAGTISISGTHSSQVQLSSNTINVAPGGTQSITINFDTVLADGGNTITATLTMTTNSDINSTCLLHLFLQVAEIDSPPTTLASNITIPRDTTCADIFTFSSTDLAYTSGSPVGRTHIRIDSLPSTGVLTYNGNILGVDIGVPLTIAEANIGLLTYTPDETVKIATSPTFAVVSSNNSGSTWG